MRVLRIHNGLALVAAAALQLMPLLRVTSNALVPVSTPMAIIFRWGAAAAALLGGLHAVSGASTTITSPGTASGKVGTAFSYRITTGPEGANIFNAAPLPAGLVVNAPGKNGFISGTPTQAGVWNVLLTASDNGIASRTVTKNLVLTITDSIPTITTQPKNQSILIGGTVTLSITATGGPPLNYQWRQNGSSLSGATSATLTLADITPDQAGAYDVIVSTSSGSVTSIAVTVTVLQPPSFLALPSAQTVKEGDFVTFSVSVGGSPPISYQWKFNGVDIPGATNANLTLTNVQGTDAGDYSVRVSNGIGAGVSPTAHLTVIVTAPSIIAPPQDQVIPVGGAASFAVTAVGGTPLKYNWRKNGGILAGATNTTLVLTNVSVAQAGSYDVIVSNAAGTVTSSAAILTILTPPSLVTPPLAQTASIGDQVTFTVIASGSTPLSYQWKFNGVDIPGATNATLVLSSVQSNAAGDYTVRVSNSQGAVESSVAHLTVQTPGPLVLVDAHLVGNTFKFHVQGPVGAAFILWTSSDLIHWVPVLTNQVTTASFEFTDPDITNDRTDFYSATLVK